MENGIIKSIETTIYKHISLQSRNVSKKNTMFNNLFKKLSDKYFTYLEAFDEYVYKYIGSLSYELPSIDVDNIYCDIIKNIFTEYILMPSFCEDPLLSKLTVNDINKLYRVKLIMEDADYYHSSYTPDYKLQVTKLSPELISVLVDLYNIQNHTHFNIDNNGKLKSHNVDVYRYLLNDNFEDNKVTFDFTDFLATIKNSAKVFNLSLGKINLIID